MKRPFVSRLHHTRGISERGFRIAGVLLLIALHYLGFADMLVQVLLCRERWLNLRPSHFQPPRRTHRVPLLGRGQTQKAFLPNHPHTGDILHRGFVHRNRHSTSHRRADHAPVQHAGHFDIHHVFRRAVELVRDIAALHTRLADDFVFARRFRFGLALHQQLVAIVLIPLKLHIKMLAADQVTV